VSYGVLSLCFFGTAILVYSASRVLRLNHRWPGTILCLGLGVTFAILALSH